MLIMVVWEASQRLGFLTSDYRRESLPSCYFIGGRSGELFKVNSSWTPGGICLKVLRATLI